MKSEHRHELQTNDLGKVADKLVPVWNTYSNQITIVVCGVMVAAAAIIYWVRRSRDAEAVAWNDLLSSRSAEDFARVADDRRGSSAAQWARLQEGESRLNSTIQLMFTDREAAVSEAKKTREAFDTLVKQSGVLPEVRERALYGLARIQETASSGSAEEAIQTYETLLKDYPNTVYKSFAEKSIATLKSGGAQEFYSWFAKQNPKPPVRPKGPADTGMLDESDADAPVKRPKKEEESDEPALKLDAAPTLDGAAKPKTAKPDAEKPDAEKPESEKPEAEKPTEEKPAEEKPNDEKPKEDKPAEEKPAEDKPESEKPAADSDSKEPAADKDQPKPEAP